MTALSFPRETSLHRNRDASLLSAIPSLRSLRISFPAPSSQQSGFRKRQSFSDCLFAFLLVAPLSRKVLRFFGSVADDLLFGNIPDNLLFRGFFYSINNFCQRQPLFPLSLRFFVCCADSPKKRCLLGNPVYRCTLRMTEKAPLSFLLPRQIKRFPPAARRI